MPAKCAKNYAAEVPLKYERNFQASWKKMTKGISVCAVQLIAIVAREWHKFCIHPRPGKNISHFPMDFPPNCVVVMNGVPMPMGTQQMVPISWIAQFAA